GGVCARRHPRRELLGGELREREEEVSEVALRIDDDRGNAVDRRLLEERDRQTGLAAAGHADDDGVRRQVFCVVEERTIAFSAEIEGAELLEVREHRPRRSITARRPASCSRTRATRCPGSTRALRRTPPSRARCASARSGCRRSSRRRRRTTCCTRG